MDSQAWIRVIDREFQSNIIQLARENIQLWLMYDQITWYFIMKFSI